MMQFDQRLYLLNGTGFMPETCSIHCVTPRFNLLFELNELKINEVFQNLIICIHIRSSEVGSDRNSLWPDSLVCDNTRIRQILIAGNAWIWISTNVKSHAPYMLFVSL